MFFYASDLSSENPVPACIIDAEDTDVYAITARVSHEIPAPLFMYRKGKYYNCKDLCSSEVRQYINEIHVISGCDSVSGFYGHGKKTIIKKAIASIQICEKLNQLGKTVPFDEKYLPDIEDFVLQCIYGEKNTTFSNIRRAKSWNKMKKKNTARLNPDLDSLLQHVKRANYQLYIYANYHDPSPPPSPFGNGWKKDSNGNILPVASTTTNLPDDIELNKTSDTVHSDEESNSEIESSDDELTSESEDELMDEF